MNVSIIIPLYNQLDYTRRCLESLQKEQRSDVEIIIVDNASTDGTADYLKTVTGITVISNAENQGCSKAWNQGIKAARGRWIAILNNDIVVTAGWLENLLGRAKNNGYDVISPGIREGELNYDINRYGSEFSLALKGVAREGTAAGECFIVRREVFDKVGMFDENFIIGQYEDTDFFKRVVMGGFRMAICGDAFVHHFGSITRQSLNKKKTVRPYAALNRAYYHKKWKLGIVRRFFIRRRNKARDFFWRNRERMLYGHSLKEKLINGKLHYY